MKKVPRKKKLSGFLRPDWLQNPPGTPINSKTTARPRATCSAATPPRAPDGTRRTPTHAPSRPNTSPRGTPRTATRPASRPASPRAHGRPRHTPAKVRPADRRAGPACGTGRTARRPLVSTACLSTSRLQTPEFPIPLLHIATPRTYDAAKAKGAYECLRFLFFLLLLLLLL